MTTPEEMDESLWRFWNAKALKQADRIEELEAKLTKARTGLRKIADYKHFVAHLGWTQNAEARIASAVLAELEKKK